MMSGPDSASTSSAWAAADRSARRRSRRTGSSISSSEDGDVFVVKAGPTYELLATNPVGEVVMATPAISDGLIIIRGVKHVMAIGQKPSETVGIDPSIIGNQSRIEYDDTHEQRIASTIVVVFVGSLGADRPEPRAPTTRSGADRTATAASRRSRRQRPGPRS